MVSFGLKLSGGSVMSLVTILMLGNVAISSVGTLFAAIVQLTHTRGSLLSILVLTILMPIMIPATLALLILFGAVPAELVGTGALAFVGDLRSAIGYMVVFDAVFVVACWLLFGFAIKE
jgi:ABC-type transport system involved in cytochrome c biogenesis permease component